MNTINEIIKKLELLPHPEGGYYREYYRSEGTIDQQSLGTPYNGKRNYATSIYFLLTSDTFLAFHRIKQDELWHFYRGAPITIHSISDSGIYDKVTLSMAIENGEYPQYVVKGGHWFAAEVTQPDSYALVGCTVAPGFDFADFELPTQTVLLEKFPQHQAIISRLGLKETCD